jgi:hypothetical protein
MLSSGQFSTYRVLEKKKTLLHARMGGSEQNLYKRAFDASGFTPLGP